jgi:exopolysaccharide biosynthesis protein
MKKLFFAISFLAITAAAFAGNNNNKKTVTPERRLDYSIQQQVVVPHMLMDRPGEHTAELYFAINADGSLKVKEIVSEEQDLTKNLLNQVQNFTVNTEGLDLKDTYKVVLKFNIE